LAASAAGFAFTVLVMRRSILTERIARRGLHLTREYSIDPFEVMRAHEIMAAPVESLPGWMTVKDAIGFFENGQDRHKSYPVVKAEGRLAGLISRGDVLRWSREGGHDGELLADVCQEVSTAFPDDTAAAIADRMAQGRFSRMPIIARDTRKLVGIVTRHELLRVRSLALRAERDHQGAVKLPV
jgi:CBS domain-containing protein